MSNIRISILTWRKRQNTAHGRLAFISFRTGTDRNVILHCAPSEFAASAGTGILTSLIDARRGVETFRVIGALRSAVRRSTDVVLQAGACRIQADNFALRVETAWIRQARISLSLRQRRRGADPDAVHEGIAGVAAGAAADRIMIHRKTIRVLSAGTGTRVRALIVNARLVLRTLGADDTSRSTGRRDAGESWLAQTHCVSVLNSAVAVGSTRRWIAWIDRRR